uniref:GpcrRhopsn4 domain-containing protein n=1 Tax=Heterorhabditis bacteriophora TaxID=37862 RepID=A0A1I7XME2_HETBA
MNVVISLCVGQILMLPVLCKLSTGILSTPEDFAYLDRFCFQSETGHLEFTLSYPLDQPVQNLLLYFDSEDQWPRAYTQLKVPLSPYDNKLTKCIIVNDTSASTPTTWVHCSGTRTFTSMRSRWWFLAISSCDLEDKGNNSNGIYVEYKLIMTNGEPTEILRFQFSDDEWLILPTDFLFLILLFILLLVNYVIGCQLTSRRLYHNTYRISTQSLLLDVTGLTMMVISYGTYAVDGVGTPFLKLMAQLFRGFAEMFFIFMVLLLARGLNVTKMKLSKVDNFALFCLISFFITSYIGMLFWEIKGFDPALVYYQSESIPGYLIAAWRIVAWIFFIFNSYFTQAASPLKKKFYTSFVILLTPWFWSGPVVLCIANYVLNNWVREGVVNIVNNCVVSYGYIVFLASLL